ncbi:thioesterase II family protein [Streptomyces albipurpureus]|uniref:Alpha/beta fold hydrolase n=1 Tax=Streptomyces albipurpureus TaxID=2897419 RepID=A0ABT0USZ9_9ACTN|nr:alpha/beta fold hydrolase [Streptomyces sp. CWNU-1]MCM2391590.1 alpha/beta fold hydrolase [Streptomyces sp. CWNU-1]
MSTNSDMAALWIRHRRASNARVRVACFPHAGGAASFFNPWQNWTPSDVEILSIQYPGHQDRILEPCLDNMDELVSRLSPFLSEFRDLPLVLFGHSMGASVAFEVCRRLESTFDLSPLRLFVSGQEAPHVPSRGSKSSNDDEALISDIRRLGEGDAGPLDDPDLRELALPAIRADFRLLESYRPQPIRTISTPISSYTGDRDPDVLPEKAQEWKMETEGSFDFRVFPGGHFYLSELGQEVVSSLLKDINYPDL